MAKVSWRDGISRKLRFEIFNRDGFTCQYCGRSAPDVVLHVDHIHPVSAGGDNARENLISCCIECNSGKRDRLVHTPTDDGLVSKAKNLRERYENNIALSEKQEFNFSFAIAFWTQQLEMGFNPEVVLEIRSLVKEFPIDYICIGLRDAAKEETNNPAWTMRRGVQNAMKYKFHEASRCLFGAIFHKHSVFPEIEWLYIIDMIFRGEYATLEQMLDILERATPDEFVGTLRLAWDEIHADCIAQEMPA